MKKHILSKVCKTGRVNGIIPLFYDLKSQITYWDKNYSFPIMEGQKFGPTSKTATIEDSDADEFSSLSANTLDTRSIETSDADEFRTFKTSITENQENSDTDEFINQAPTKQTFTIEDSDVDEFSFEF